METSILRAMSAHLPAFRLGDIRGVYPDDLDYDFAVQFAQAFAHHFALKGTVAVGRDMRASSVTLQDGLLKGFTSAGIHVVNLGLCTTELGYFASSAEDIEAVIMVTASHNPPRYNGFKSVLSNGIGIHFENGLAEVMALMLSGHLNRASQKGSVTSRDYHARYIEFLRTRFEIDPTALGTIALNGLNGTASTLAADIAYAFELPTQWFRKEPGPIPDEGADPVNPKLRLQMSAYMQSAEFSLGVAWDGDCDRCVFFDDRGHHIPAYYMVGLLADQILKQQGPGAVVYDTKVYWNLQDIIRRHGATPVPSATGHAFMKQNMKKHKAIYGGELASHHYFGDFFYCDSGMYAWLKVVELLGTAPASLEELVSERRNQFKCSPEISIALADVDRAFDALRQSFGDTACNVETFDGLAFDMGEWRFSVKESKTEPCTRLNIETTGSDSLILEQGTSILTHLEPYRADDQDWLAKLKS